ncbi:hypothetical protein Sipo8835_05315 [Streptomyces ipomoeae]|uniref:Uncharacterized protein n=2 Tax=Streptomyces ipomoeae TaxID=103232 RepID=L1KUB2_9ACTN|nr:hypothetical protein [Streptomyces ipomoeae]EKX64217.1 hypothetical protein STRIP9103_06453 [Streptomyces ipomoeae 91-03]MDX2696402.1 hypothetical protein [Streptomyces ipomoeae]MDX2842138.1 hypothetical protein [Streptomyces ipomoeae]TQE25081.1 hypothetical protein Sipo7851_35355 [Streptomyces ipomoeae]TQE38330.1 hypothetical protein Sipo8835_05315 [Streptomyces ipomoeae]
MIGEATADGTSLPGIKVWLARLLDDLHSGRSCLWLLPRSMLKDAGNRADRLLDDVLHELADFLLLPSDESPASASALSLPSARPTGGRWTGLAPVPGFDDGLPDLPTAQSPARLEPEPPTPPTSAEALAGLLERLAKELGFSDGADTAGSDPTGDVLARLTGRGTGTAETRPVVVRAWREPVPSAAAHLLRRLAATVKEAGLPPDRRPRALVVASTEDLPTGLPDQLPREDIAVHWWWGATGRLDTATVVALARPPLASPTERGHLHEAVAQATITEVCGPFLIIAAALASRWDDGSPESLSSALHDVIADLPGPAAIPPQRAEGTRHPGRRPDERLLAAWNAGTVDSWDGRLRRHPGYDLMHEQAVAARVWLAQNHVLLPLLDDARDQFTTTVRLRARVPLARLAQDYGPRLEPGAAPEPADSAVAMMELGAMWSAHCDGAITLSSSERRRLRILREARNLLAHRVPPRQ